MGKVRVGVIGTGTIANAHATALKDYPGGEIVAIYDVLGEVYHVRSSRWRFRGRPGHHIFPESRWFLDMGRAGGGAMMDIAVYQIDSVLWLLGNPKVTSVMASMRQITEEPPPAGVTQDV